MRRRGVTPTMAAALAAVVAAFDSAVSRERARWGDESAARVAAKGVEIEHSVMGIGTRDALVNRGLLVITSVSESEDRDFRRGAFGRWIGGAVTRVYTAVRYAPTDAGRAVLEACAVKPAADPTTTRAERSHL